MEKRGEYLTVINAFYLILALAVVLIGAYQIRMLSDTSTLSDKYIALDASLMLETAELSPGKLNLNYKFGDRELVIRKNKIVSNLVSFNYFLDQTKDLLIIKKSKSDLKIRNTNFEFPVSNRIITSCFGKRSIEEGSRNHKGIDLRADKDPVKAIAEGTITSFVSGLGTDNTLIIKHSNNLETRYIHLDSSRKDIEFSGTKCIKNCEVKKGEIIATSGQHGRKSHTQYSPHLHFELMVDGVKRDPINYIFNPRNFNYVGNSNCFDKDNSYVHNYLNIMEENKVS